MSRVQLPIKGFTFFHAQEPGPIQERTFAPPAPKPELHTVHRRTVAGRGVTWYVASRDRSGRYSIENAW